MAEELIEKIVEDQGNGIRLDRCLRLWISSLPQGLIEKAARKGNLRVQGEKAKPSTRVEEGQIISFPKVFLNLSVDVPQKLLKALTTADKKWLKDLILFEDNDIIVINKPAGIAVQGGTKQSKSLDAMLEAYREDCKPRLVHRLDRDTSGVLVFAKTLSMARWLTQAFKERTVQKVYWALVCGVPKKREGVISLPLSKKADAMGEKVRIDQEEGARATTYYRTIDSLGNKVAWLELIPKTGRMHQLRVHCAEGLKTPIMGDGKYGGKEAFPLGRKLLHLHAQALILPMPDGKNMSFCAPLPKELQETFAELGFINV
ncbi:MAG: RluA family pseudouridine synthase [Alphaproteobacteria bacterium]|nr:RluA family pseudouridine synthase [Alphaproteobacteria bacterium]